MQVALFTFYKINPYPLAVIQRITSLVVF